MSELDPETTKRLEAAVADLDAGKGTPTKRRTRKKTEPIDTVEAEQAAEAEGMRPVQFTDEPVEVEDAPAEAERPILSATGLVRENDYARNSESVRAVQDALAGRGRWEVRADPSGYWGTYTQDAAEALTGEEDPVAAARSLGFTVI